MATSLTCPECAATLSVPETFLGKTLRCKHCGETFKAKAPKRPVEEDDEPRPAKKRPRDDDDDNRPRKVGKKKRKQKPKSQTPLILGLIGGVVVLAGVGIGIAYFAGAFDSRTKAAGSGAAVASGGSGGGSGQSFESIPLASIRVGSPPRQAEEYVRLSLVGVKDNFGHVELTIGFEFLPGHATDVEYTMVVIRSDGNDTLYIDPEDAMRGQRFIEDAVRPTEIWVAKRKRGTGLSDVGPRVSNVITY
jgi:hypothetical protein